MTQKESPGEMVKELRISAGLTQAKLAESLGCSIGLISKLELDDRRPSDWACEKIAEICSKPEAAEQLKVMRAPSKRGLKGVPRRRLGVATTQDSAAILITEEMLQAAVNEGVSELNILRQLVSIQDAISCKLSVETISSILRDMKADINSRSG